VSTSEGDEDLVTYVKLIETGPRVAAPKTRLKTSSDKQSSGHHSERMIGSAKAVVRTSGRLYRDPSPERRRPVLRWWKFDLLAVDEWDLAVA